MFAITWMILMVAGRYFGQCWIIYARFCQNVSFFSHLVSLLCHLWQRPSIKLNRIASLYN